MDVLRRLGAQRTRELAMELLVRPVVVAADDVRDPELDIVDDAGKLIRGRSVLAQERDPPEAVASEPGRSLAIDVLALALAYRPLIPVDAEPLEVGTNRLLASRNVACRIGVVDPQQEPVAEVAIGDRAQRVADVERARRAGCEAHSRHKASVGGFDGKRLSRWAALLAPQRRAMSRQTLL